MILEPSMSLLDSVTNANYAKMAYEPNPSARPNKLCLNEHD